MPRLPRKRWRLEESIKTRAHLQAVAKWKASELGYASSMRDHVGKMIDKIDPIELTATIGLAFLVYDVIKLTPELLLSALKSKWFQMGTNIFQNPIISLVWSAVFGSGSLTPGQKAEFEKIQNETDVKLFLESFGIAYILVKQGIPTGGVAAAVAGFFSLKVV